MVGERGTACPEIECVLEVRACRNGRLGVATAAVPGRDGVASDVRICGTPSSPSANVNVEQKPSLEVISNVDPSFDL